VGTLVEESVIDVCVCACAQNQIRPELDLMGKAAFYFGPVGSGSKMKLVVNMVMGTVLASLAEGIALAEAASLSAEQLLEVLDLGVMSNMMFKVKGQAMLKRSYDPQVSRAHAALFRRVLSVWCLASSH
jgi:glyoxylate/succinic semialdehyde reductase